MKRIGTIAIELSHHCHAEIHAGAISFVGPSVAFPLHRHRRSDWRRQDARSPNGWGLDSTQRSSSKIPRIRFLPTSTPIGRAPHCRPSFSTLLEPPSPADVTLRQADLFSQVTVCDYLFDKDKIFAYLSNLDDNELFIYQRLCIVARCGMSRARILSCICRRRPTSLLRRPARPQQPIRMSAAAFDPDPDYSAETERATAIISSFTTTRRPLLGRRNFTARRGRERRKLWTICVKQIRSAGQNSLATARPAASLTLSLRHC